MKGIRNKANECKRQKMKVKEREKEDVGKTKEEDRSKVYKKTNK